MINFTIWNKNISDMRYLDHLTGPVSDLLQIESNFGKLYVPSKSLRVERSQFEPTLEEMYQKDEEDQGIVFSKT